MSSDIQSPLTASKIWRCIEKKDQIEMVNISISSGSSLFEKYFSIFPVKGKCKLEKKSLFYSHTWKTW